MIRPEVEWYILENLPRTTLQSYFTCFKVAAICVRVATARRGTTPALEMRLPSAHHDSKQSPVDVRTTPNQSPAP